MSCVCNFLPGMSFKSTTSKSLFLLYQFKYYFIVEYFPSSLKGKQISLLSVVLQYFLLNLVQYFHISCFFKIISSSLLGSDSMREQYILIIFASPTQYSFQAVMDGYSNSLLIPDRYILKPMFTDSESLWSHPSNIHNYSS